jgi:hypothetical protein
VPADADHPDSDVSRDARSSGAASPPADTRFGGRLLERRQIQVAVDADRAFGPIARIGGERGWYFGTWLRRFRGAVDLLMGGVGMRPRAARPLMRRPSETPSTSARCVIRE